MITYEVTASVDASLVDTYENYMMSKHLTDVLGIARAAFEEPVGEVAADETRAARHQQRSQNGQHRLARVSSV